MRDIDGEMLSFHLTLSKAKAMAGAQLTSEPQTVVGLTGGGGWE